MSFIDSSELDWNNPVFIKINLPKINLMRIEPVGYINATKIKYVQAKLAYDYTHPNNLCFESSEKAERWAEMNTIERRKALKRQCESHYFPDIISFKYDRTDCFCHHFKVYVREEDLNLLEYNL